MSTTVKPVTQRIKRITRLLEKKPLVYTPIGYAKNSGLKVQKLDLPVIAQYFWKEDYYTVCPPWEQCFGVKPPTWDRLVGYTGETNDIPVITKDCFLGKITILTLLDDGGLVVKGDEDDEYCYGIAEILCWSLY